MKLEPITIAVILRATETLLWHVDGLRISDQVAVTRSTRLVGDLPVVSAGWRVTHTPSGRAFLIDAACWTCANQAARTLDAASQDWGRYTCMPPEGDAMRDVVLDAYGILDGCMHFDDEQPEEVPRG